jgi:hypothetical protein
MKDSGAWDRDFAAWLELSWGRHAFLGCLKTAGYGGKVNQVAAAIGMPRIEPLLSREEAASALIDSRTLHRSPICAKVML